MAKKKLASEAGATTGASLQQMKKVQQQAATPYVVLSGTVKPGQSRDALSGGWSEGAARHLSLALALHLLHLLQPLSGCPPAPRTHARCTACRLLIF